MASLHTALRELRAVVDPARRYVDLALDIQGPDGDIILGAGGCWDSARMDFVDRPHKRHVVRVTRAQEQAARQLATWLKQYDERDEQRMALEIYVDNRRGGKTFFTCLFVIAFLLRYPRSHLGRNLGWIVCPTYPQQREVLETLGKILPPEWLRDDGCFKFSKTGRDFTLPTGAILALKSADRPQTLKAGGVAVIGINEATQCAARAILNCLGNNIDTGGVTAMAMNPPDSTIGLWAENLHHALDEEGPAYDKLRTFCRETRFPPAGNDMIDQGARSRFSTLAQVIDPKQEKRDGQGLWVSIKDRCYPLWERKVHVLRGPQLQEVLGWQDITAQLNALTGTLRVGEMRREGIGMDFQHKPWCAAVRGKAFAAPPGNRYELAPGTPVYVMTEDAHNDVEVGQWWTEQMLCEAILERGWNPKDALVIADGTGNKQGATAEQRGLDHDPQVNSFPLVRNYGFEIHAPIEHEVYREVAGRGTDKLITCSNPAVSVRLNMVLDLLQTRRFFVAEGAKDLAESFRVCEAKHKHPYGWGAHLTDAAGYLCYRWEVGWKEAARRGRRR